MKFICLGSGSSGNCYYLLSDGIGIVIDLGIGIRAFKKYFREYGLALAQISCILVTHEHADHVRAVGTLSNEFHIPVYATSCVHQGMSRNYHMTKKVDKENIRLFEQQTTITIGPFRITSFKVPHDSSDNSGYYVECGNKSFCLMTDAGHMTDEMKSFISKSENLIVEANYDAQMLETGPYPHYLKKRISGERGHLCNDETADTLSACLTCRTQHIWLCHLSEENNHPELARKTVSAGIENAGFELGKDIKLEVLKRKTPSLLYEL